MNTLSQALSRMLRTTVIDKAGLTGQYNVRLEWTPDEASPPDTVAPSDVIGPSLFTAIGEQLGLKLVPKKVPVEVVVIDHVDQPSEN